MITVCWDVMICRLVYIYRRFGETKSQPHIQEDSKFHNESREHLKSHRDSNLKKK
jgi:hypothetical protein